ncbi:MAG: hypothetical protein LC790_09750 [Actinobacteria bacterium]|nr:hypothetical protein [Actinomycetota bacterium]
MLVGERPRSGRPVVFVSYSRADADWLPRFETTLKPLVSGRGAELLDWPNESAAPAERRSGPGLPGRD